MWHKAVNQSQGSCVHMNTNINIQQSKSCSILQHLFELMPIIAKNIPGLLNKIADAAVNQLHATQSVDMNGEAAQVNRITNIVASQPALTLSAVNHVTPGQASCHLNYSLSENIIYVF